MVALAPRPIGTTRFQFDAAGRIVVTARLDGAPHPFILDTAAPSTSVSPAVAQTLHGRVRTERRAGHAIDDVSLEILGITLPHQTLQIPPDDLDVDGILGADVWKRFLVKVDFRGRRITVWQPSVDLKAGKAIVVPADFTNDVPVIAVRLAAAGVRERAATLIVGLAVPPQTATFTYRFAADAGLLDAAKDGELDVDLRGVGQRPLSARARLPREPERSPLLVADGVISARALTRSWIVFDARHQRIVLGR
jgi:hypothetical protein